MTINKYKLKIIWTYILITLVFSYDGLCQSYSIIDIDKAGIIKLPEKQKEDPIPDGMLSFNNIIKIKRKGKVSFIDNNIYRYPLISNGNVFINPDKNKSVYDLESTNEITNATPFHYRYKVFKFKKKKLHQSLLGSSYNIINYIASVDQTTGDTLWVKQGKYLTVCQTNTISYIKNGSGKPFLVDNKTGKKLFKLSSSNPLSISEIKKDNGYLFLRKSDEIIAIDIQKGEAIWRVKGDFNKFFVDETRIYTSNQCAIDKKTGNLIWNNSSDIWIVAIVGNYLIGYLYLGEDNPEIFVYNKNTGKLAGYLWSDNEFCASCFGYTSCDPEFIFAEQGEANKTAALIKCKDGVYLYIFEVSNQY